MNPVLIVFLGMIVLFLVLGLTFSRGKGAFLIAGYNTASKAEKARYDEKALCRFMGKIMFALAGCQGIMALGILVVGMWLLWVGIAAFLAVAFWTVSTPTPETAFERTDDLFSGELERSGGYGKIGAGNPRLLRF